MLLRYQKGIVNGVKQAYKAHRDWQSPEERNFRLGPEDFIWKYCSVDAVSHPT